MIEYYTNESAAALLREVTGINEFPDNCSGLAACLNAAIAKIQANYTPVDKRNDDNDWIKYPCIAIIIIFSIVMIGMFFGNIAFLITYLLK